MVEKVLPYSRDQVTQDTGWNCGPASGQTVILSKTGQTLPESVLAREMRTTQNGTDHISQVANVLNARLGGGYIVRGIPNDPPTRDQVELLWSDVVKSIDAGFGVVGNIMVPPSNYPRGTRGSSSPAYGGGMVYHYIAIMGYADDGPGGRHFWVADSGFRPFGYWCSLEQMASMIAGKGYTAKPVAAPAPPPPAHLIANTELGKRYPSRSKYRTSDAPIDTLAGFILNIDARMHERWFEQGER
ncbi:MAG: hypothetical protein DI630_16905 [Gordonia sp. (in: high G+C Gram-positive bacteria)]|nr:MAG: hypothetical protein DI630_16905 [Gordonia sp. (in: high G+C Gram-positive bacteria)]